MTDTVISSATKEVVIGFDRPFVMIGERINPTGRKLLAAEMKEGDFSRVQADAVAQVKAGCHRKGPFSVNPASDQLIVVEADIHLRSVYTFAPQEVSDYVRGNMPVIKTNSFAIKLFDRCNAGFCQCNEARKI